MKTFFVLLGLSISTLAHADPAPAFDCSVTVNSKGGEAKITYKDTTPIDETKNVVVSVEEPYTRHKEEMCGSVFKENKTQTRSFAIRDRNLDMSFKYTCTVKVTRDACGPKHRST